MRAIGEEITLVYPPANWASDGRCLTTAKSGMNFTVWRYRVTGHNQGREVIEPVDAPDNPRYVEPEIWAPRYGRLTPIPPAELLPLMDDSWSPAKVAVRHQFERDHPGDCECHECWQTMEAGSK